jgi:chaperonin cofactor prefoldin
MRNRLQDRILTLKELDNLDELQKDFERLQKDFERLQKDFERLQKEINKLLQYRKGKKQGGKK